jgi:hypothetical protein
VQQGGVLGVHARRIGPGLSLLAGLSAMAATPAARVAAAPAAPIIDVRLTTSIDLPHLVTSVLRAEAAAIWGRAGVHLRWPSAPRDAPAAASLRVLVLQREGPAVTGHSWAVGELLRDQADQPFAVVSTTAARRVVAIAGHDGEPQALSDRRLGVVLGRAVAHEIGHFLLATRGHARTGLMRAHVDVTDFADLRSGGFHLDRDAGAWIRAWLPHPAQAGQTLARFSYQPR